jgi:hypothetical protein
LSSGEKININESWTKLRIRFADALSVAYAEHKKQTIGEQFKKGKKIWFWLLDLDKQFLYYDNKAIPRNEISEIKKARSDRYVLVNDAQEKKLAKRDLNNILDEDLLFPLLAEIGKYHP